MSIGIKSFFLTIIVGLGLLFNPIARATDAGLLPWGVTQYFDNNGNPLTSGYVYYYEVGTTTFKTTWKDSAKVTPNTNPVRLNAAGRAIIYGDGLYRQVLKDVNQNLIWDAVTSPSGGGGSTPTAVGDGNLVGTVLPWSGLIAPNQYVFAYGQEIARATYPEFFTAVTQQVNVICSSASNTLTGLADTTQINIGSPIELALCVIPGSTVVSKTASTVTLSNPSSVSINAVATFFPFGNGNGTTTFNVPDLRGYAVAGRDNMGGTAAGRLTSTYFNTPGLGAVGGNQSHTLLQAELPAFKPALALTDPGHVHGPGGVGNFALFNGPSSSAAAGAGVGFNNTANTASATTGISINFVNNLGSATPFSNVQPTITLNYIVKVTPDTSTSIATGVYSIGGMTGVIACGTGILCTGNIISFNASTFAGGSDTNIQFNSTGNFAGSPNHSFISPDTLTLGAVGTTGKFDIYGTTSGKVRQTVQSVAGTPTVTWGTATGTPAVTASSPLAITSATGNITCTTCLTNTPSALTKVDDTNVTLTLGGSPTVALLSPTSLTLGWTGQLGLTRGGTNASLTASNGGIVYSGALALAILSGTATANLPLLSGSSTTPAWSGITYPTVAINGGIPYFASTSVMSSSSLLTANQIMIGGGAATAPTTFACATTTTVVHGGTPPTCGQIVAGDITTNTITNSNLSQTGAATLKGNPTASLANVQDFTIQNLTNNASPSATLDYLVLYDHTTGTLKSVTPGAIAGSAVAGVSAVNTLTGGLTLAATSGLNIVSAGTTITITPDIATAANFEAGTAQKLLDSSVIFTTETTTTFGSTTAFDFNTFINTKVTLTNNITTMNCSNMKASQAGTITFIQDGTGSRTAAFNTGTCSTILKFAGATFPTLTTSASALDVLSYSCRTTSYCVAALSKGYNP